MRVLNTEFKVGLFFLTALGLIGYMFHTLDQRFFVKQKQYYTLLANASGVIEKTQVKTNGVSIGKVKTIKLLADVIRLEFDIDADVFIPKGSTIQIKTRGLLGDVFLEIRRSGRSEELEVESYIPMDTDHIDMAKLINLTGSIAEDIKYISGHFSKMFKESNISIFIKNFFINIEKITRKINIILYENEKNILLITQNLQLSTRDFGKIIQQERENFHQLVLYTKHAAEEFQKLGGRLNTTFDKKKIEKFFQSFDASMRDIQIISRNMRFISERIESGQGSLGKIVNDTKITDEIQSTLKNVREMLSSVNKLETLIDVQSEFRRKTGNQNYYNLFLEPRPDKFFMLGVTSMREQRVTTVTETLGKNDAVVKDGSRVDSVKRETVYTEEALRFNLQYGRRFSFLTLRVGLFESEGGLGVDLHFFNNRLFWSIEAFGWGEDSLRIWAHFKTSLSWKFFDHLLLKVGLDDFTRYGEPDGRHVDATNFFLGAGLRFNDEDLKKLFGLVSFIK